MPGEGRLIDVLLVPADQERARCLTLVIDRLGNMFSGELFTADPQEPDVIDRLYAALRNCLNRTLQNIGNVEVDL